MNVRWVTSDATLTPQLRCGEKAPCYQCDSNTSSSVELLFNTNVWQESSWGKMFYWISQFACEQKPRARRLCYSADFCLFFSFFLKAKARKQEKRWLKLINLLFRKELPIMFAVQLLKHYAGGDALDSFARLERMRSDPKLSGSSSSKRNWMERKMNIASLLILFFFNFIFGMVTF